MAQIIGALIMIGVGGVGAFVMYFILYVLPIKPVAWLLEWYILQYSTVVLVCNGFVNEKY